MTGTKKTIICVFVSVVLIAVPSFAWTNNNPVEIMKIDLTELRTYIDAIRTNIGLSAYSWTDSTLTGNTMFKLAHFQDLRTAIEAVATASGATASQWGDTLASGGVMRLLHIVGPRSNITALNTTVNSWYCCGSYGGANTGSVGACPGTDDSACGTIDCDGLNYYFTEGSASPTGTNYCKLRDYADLTSGRCEGINNCKDANTGDCTSYGDSTAATCGTCCYASGACSSCSYYSTATQGPTADYYFTEGSASPTGTNYCKLRNYYCTGNSCGETYSDSTAATCGTCCYASGACSSCTNYGSGTQGTTGDYYYASGGTCYYRDYHCTGSSCGETYSDSAQITCSGTCRYVSGCSGGTPGSCSTYSGGSNGCYSGSYGGYTWYYQSGAGGTSCDTICGYWGKSCNPNSASWGNSINDCTKAVAVFSAVGISTSCSRSDNHAAYPGYQTEYYAIWPSVTTTCDASASPSTNRICVCS